MTLELEREEVSIAQSSERRGVMAQECTKGFLPKKAGWGEAGEIPGSGEECSIDAADSAYMK